MPDQELRAPRAVFNTLNPKSWHSYLGKKLDDIVTQIMEVSNCYEKTTNVTARVLKGIFSLDREKMRENLTVEDIQIARIAQFMVSMGPTMAAWQ